MASQVGEKRLLIVGGGAMGGSIARGVVQSGLWPAEQVTVCDLDSRVLDALQQDAQVQVTTDLAAALDSAPDVVIWALKPQVLPGVLAAQAGRAPEALAVSIAAGVTLETLEGLLGEKRRVVRVMPNLPVAVRQGASAVSGGRQATPEDVALVAELFGALGSVAVLREDQLDAAGALSGCGPAYFALMVDALTRAGVQAGLPASVARDLVNATMGGVSALLAQGSEHPRAFMERVTSPGGTTAAALRAMEPLLQDACYQAVDAALERTYELAEASR